MRHGALDEVAAGTGFPCDLAVVDVPRRVRLPPRTGVTFLAGERSTLGESVAALTGTDRPGGRGRAGQRRRAGPDPLGDGCGRW